VPEEGLNAALAVIARLSGKHDLSLDRLKKKASPASPEGGLACALWRVEASSLAAARKVVDDPSLRDADLPEARVAEVDRGHIHDVIEALGQLLSALERAGTSLVVLGSR
jgi:hypothetical protein